MTWIHQTGDLYECSNCGLIEHIKPLWTRCPICGEPGKAKTIDDGFYQPLKADIIKAGRKPSEEEWWAYAEKLQQEAIRIREEEEKRR